MKDSWYFRNIEYAKAYQKEYRLNNPGIHKAKEARYRANKYNAVPKWFNGEHNKETQNIYQECRNLSINKGFPHQVDHIVPLNGETVCGLHVPWNLQIVSASYNSAKKNRLDVELDEEFYEEKTKKEYNSGFNNLSKTIICHNTGEIFYSVNQAAIKYNCNNTNISRVCNRTRRYYKGLIFSFYTKGMDLKILEKEYIDFWNPMDSRIVCVETGEIFLTTKEAAEFCGERRTHIKYACEGGKNGRYKTCKGYNWMYYKDYKKLETKC